MTRPLRTGLIGCGAISDTYLAAAQLFDSFEIVACADARPDAAARAAEGHDLEILSVDDLLGSPHIDAVLNLTTPDAHAAIGVSALEAGKHAYSEKPMATNVADGTALLAAASRSGRLAGCAPDTFLGTGHQACRELVDRGAIGEPIAATAILMHRGHEAWHPDPVFFYLPGAGPLFDMGPYFLTALVNLIGPIAEVTAMTSRGFDAREILSEPRRGDLIEVDVDTHVAGTIRFVDGVIATVVMSFDVCHHDLPRLQLHGTEASLSLPDPNQFSGRVSLSTGRSGQWIDQPVNDSSATDVRGLGFADMCAAAAHNRAPRCGAELAFHVLEVMAAFETSARTRRHVTIASRVGRPAPLLGDVLCAN